MSELFPDTSLSGDEENNEDFFYHGLLNADSSTVWFWLIDLHYVLYQILCSQISFFFILWFVTVIGYLVFVYDDPWV